LDGEERESEPLALLGEGTGGGRQPFALGERVLERGEALAGELERLVSCRRLRGGVRPGAEGGGERLGRLAPQRDPLRGAPQPVESRVRRLARAGSVRQLVL